jgi:hypothetical protein
MNIPKYCSVCGEKLKFKIKIKDYNEFSGKPNVYLEGRCALRHTTYESKSSTLNLLLYWIDSDDDIEYTLDSKLRK